MCGSLNVFGPQKLTGSGTIKRCGLVGGAWMAHAFNLDLEAGGNAFNLGHTFWWKCVTVGAGFEVFFLKLHSV